MIRDRDVVVVNLLILLLLTLMFIGTVISSAAGLGLMIGAAIVTFWNIARL